MSIFSQSKTSACPAFRPNRLPSWHTVISASDSHSCILRRKKDIGTILRINFVNPKGAVFI